MRFRNRFKFLSNFYPAKIVAWGIEFPTAEHVYVASKTKDTELRKTISELTTPGKAKRFGRKLVVRNDWEQVRVKVMRGILRRKFADGHLMESLKAVAGEIVEHNTWHDNFWGACVCEGCDTKVKINILGKLLMEIREKS